MINLSIGCHPSTKAFRGYQAPITSKPRHQTRHEQESHQQPSSAPRRRHAIPALVGERDTPVRPLLGVLDQVGEHPRADIRPPNRVANGRARRRLVARIDGLGVRNPAGADLRQALRRAVEQQGGADDGEGAERRDVGALPRGLREIQLHGALVGVRHLQRVVVQLVVGERDVARRLLRARRGDGAHEGRGFARADGSGLAELAQRLEQHGGRLRADVHVVEDDRRGQRGLELRGAAQPRDHDRGDGAVWCERLLHRDEVFRVALHDVQVRVHLRVGYAMLLSEHFAQLIGSAGDCLNIVSDLLLG